MFLTIMPKICAGSQVKRKFGALGGAEQLDSHFPEGGVKEALKIWRFEEKRVIPNWRILSGSPRI